MSNLWVRETHVHLSKQRDEDGEPKDKYLLDDTSEHETAYAHPGELYRALQREHGRCTGYVYVDRKDGATLRVGWVFVKTDHYTDTQEPYTHETWVTVLTGPTKVTVIREPQYYAQVGA